MSSGPPRCTVQSAIHARQCQPEPTPLHAGEDDSGDTGRRYGTPARSVAARLDTHDQWLVGGARRRQELSHRGERHCSEELSHGSEGRRSEELSHRGGDRRSLTRGVEEAGTRPHRARPAPMVPASSLPSPLPRRPR